MVLGGGLGGGIISTPAQLLQMRLSPLRHSLAQPLAPGPRVILFSLFVLRTFCCCVSRVHPAPLLTRGSKHFGRVIRSCWTLTLKFSLVVRLILSRILRHLLARYLLEVVSVTCCAAAPSRCLADALARPLPAYPGFACCYF